MLARVGAGVPRQEHPLASPIPARGARGTYGRCGPGAWVTSARVGRAERAEVPARVRMVIARMYSIWRSAHITLILAITWHKDH